jgi:hypothetical protein
LRKLHNEEVNDLCSSQNIIHVVKSSRMRWVGKWYEQVKWCTQVVLVMNPGGNRPLGRPSCTREYWNGSQRNWLGGDKLDCPG